MDLFEKDDTNPVKDMIMVCVQRELMWVLDKDKKADDHFG